MTRFFCCKDYHMMKPGLSKPSCWFPIAWEAGAIRTSEIRNQLVSGCCSLPPSFAACWTASRGFQVCS
jgi:hypothetical protein